MPQCFRVLVHGSGFCVDVGGSAPAVGFYARRRIKASTEDELQARAADAISQDKRTLGLIQLTEEPQGSSDTCQIEIEECYALTWWQRVFTRCPVGFIFYTDEDELEEEEGGDV